MSDGVKVQGLDDIRKLLGREQLWKDYPPELDRFLHLVKQVIVTSKYKDAYLDGGLDLRDFQAYVKMKTRRICQHPDLEECIDVAAYSFMMFHRLMLMVPDDNNPYAQNEMQRIRSGSDQA